MIPILSSFLLVSYLLAFWSRGSALRPLNLRALSLSLGLWGMNWLFLYVRSLNPEFFFSLYLHQSRIYGFWTEVLMLLSTLFLLLGLPGGWFRFSRSRAWYIGLLFLAHPVFSILVMSRYGDFAFYLPIWTPGLIERLWPGWESRWGWFFFPLIWIVFFLRGRK